MPSTIQPPQPYPAYFIGHAGVGLLFNESSNNRTVQANLRNIGKEILSLSPRPKAIIVFSGHFEAGEIHGPGVIEGEPSFPTASCQRAMAFSARVPVIH
jgi:aromatic ring-opening dioxygenase catalytic subunit (LigB family)